MPAISFFADERDVAQLRDRLNADPVIAFVVPDGPIDPQEAYSDRLCATAQETGATVIAGFIDTGYRQRWKCVRAVEHLNDGDHSLWHIPAGPLPLLVENGPDQVIKDPWSGWTEQRPGADPLTPYFGNSEAEIRLSLWTRHRAYSEEERMSLPKLISWWDNGHDMLVASDFQWVERYSAGRRLTRNWWKRLRAWMDRSAVRLVVDSETYWAFPSALAKLKGGMAYYSRLWPLDEAIRKA